MNAIKRILALTASIGWLSTAAAVEAVLTNDDFTPRPRGVTSRSASIVIKPTTTGIFTFDLGTLPDGAQTPPAVIDRAILKLFVNKVTNNGSITVSTPEGPSVTFPNPFIGVVSRSYTAFDVTPLVQAKLASGSIELRVTTDSASVVVDSKENAATSHPASLDIELNPTASPNLMVPASSITGQLTAAQLQPSLTLNGTTNGTFSGNGSGLTSLNGANVTTGSIPLAALVPRVLSNGGAGAGGIARGTVGSFALTSANGLQDVPGLTVTLTTTGRPVFVGIARGVITATNSADEGGGQRTAGVSVKILRNGNAIATPELFTRNTSGNIPNQARWPAGSVWHIDDPAPGQTTYKIQAQVTGSGNAGFDSVELFAFEL